MDPGIRSPLVDFFRRGDVARDVRLQAAQGALAPRAIDQLALLLVLLDDGDPEVARSASATIDRLPQVPLSGFLANPDVSAEMRAFFAARGIQPSGEAPQTDEPLIDDGQEEVAEGPPNEDDLSTSRRLAQMNVMQRIKVAMRGRREERSILIRDPNRLVSVATSFFVGAAHEDIGVVTEPGHRGRGLSTSCAAAVVADIRARGHRPTWTTSPDNTGSRAVAGRLGFVHERDDVLYAVGVPIPVD